MTEKTDKYVTTLPDKPHQMGMKGFNADRSLPGVKLADILDQFAPIGVKLPADEVVNREFEIVRARPFESSYDQQDHAYFVVGYDPGDDLLFNTTLGGSAVVELLDLWSAANRAEPLIVKLVWNEGGKYKGYYTLE